MPHRSGDKENFLESNWIIQEYLHFTGLTHFQDHFQLDVGCAMLTTVESHLEQAFFILT